MTRAIAPGKAVPPVAWSAVAMSFFEKLTKRAKEIAPWILPYFLSAFIQKTKLLGRELRKGKIRDLAILGCLKAMQSFQDGERHPSSYHTNQGGQNIFIYLLAHSTPTGLEGFSSKFQVGM